MNKFRCWFKWQITYQIYKTYKRFSNKIDHRFIHSSCCLHLSWNTPCTTSRWIPILLNQKEYKTHLLHNFYFACLRIKFQFHNCTHAIHCTFNLSKHLIQHILLSQRWWAASGTIELFARVFHKECLLWHKITRFIWMGTKRWWWRTFLLLGSSIGQIYGLGGYLPI